MQHYPISIPLDCYRGRDPRRQAKAGEYNRLAARIENYVNNEMRQQPVGHIQQYLSQTLARQLGEDTTLVHRIIFSVDCGHNGMTIFKPDPDKF